MQTQTEAWNRGDVDGFMTAYKESVDTTYIGKQIAQGYEHIRASYKEHYTSPEAMGKLTFSDLNVRSLGENSLSLLESSPSPVPLRPEAQPRESSRWSGKKQLRDGRSSSITPVDLQRTPVSTRSSSFNGLCR